VASRNWHPSACILTAVPFRRYHEKQMKLKPSEMSADKISLRGKRQGRKWLNGLQTHRVISDWSGKNRSNDAIVVACKCGTVHALLE